MAQKPLGTEAAERMNLVAQDEIWRYRLKAESEARKNWAHKWGFLTTPFEELIQDEEEPHTPKPKIELPEHFRIRPVTPVEKYIKDTLDPLTSVYDLPGGVCQETDFQTSLKVCVKKVLPSPPVPQTTQGFIGWRSAVPGLNKCLQHDHEIRSCKGAYARELGWPEKGIH